MKNNAKDFVFDVIEVENDAALSAKIMFPDRFIIPKCYTEYILQMAANAACSVFLECDDAFWEEREKFKKYTMNILIEKIIKSNVRVIQ